MDRSLRHLGQLLVVMGALLGAALGVALALIVGNATTSGVVVASGPERAAVLAAGPPALLGDRRRVALDGRSIWCWVNSARWPTTGGRRVRLLPSAGAAGLLVVAFISPRPWQLAIS